MAGKQTFIVPKSSIAFTLLCFQSIAFVGCTDRSDPIETGDTDEPVVEECSPALQITASSTATQRYGTLQFSATGGTGNYRFSLGSKDNGSTIQELTGTYLAGSVENAEDTIWVHDTECTGSASVSIQITAPFTIEPEAITVAPNTDFLWSIQGGTGNVETTFEQNLSGAELTGDNQARTGQEDGHDIIHITDTQLGVTRAIRVYVNSGTILETVGSQYILPLGGIYEAQTIGGSGLYDATVLNGDIEVSGQTLSATVAGLSTVQITDKYVPSLNAQVQVTVSPPLGLNNDHPGGLLRQQGATLSPGDINGDGYVDAIFGNQEIHSGGYNSGAVMIYSGTSDGLNPEPAQVLYTAASLQRFGHSLSYGDFNQDGIKDLAVGAPYANGTSVQNGGVYIFNGLADGFFEEQPSHLLIGGRGYDRFGYAIASCDYNGDGHDDLIVTSTDAEDRSAIDPVSAQGRIDIFYSSASGLPEESQHVIWGQTWSGSQWEGTEDLKLGFAVTTGDFNGDNQCDIATSTYNWAYDGDGSDGVVFLYTGLEKEPFYHAVYEHPTHSGQFGRSIASADFDQDGTDELVVGAPYAAPESTQMGAAYLFWVGEPIDSEDNSPIFAADADWVRFADSNAALFGKSITVGDVTMDGIPDLVLNAPSDEISSAAYTTGVSVIFDGIAIADRVANSDGIPVDATLDTPLYTIGGPTANQRSSESVAVLDDFDGDGISELISYASTDSSFGSMVGAAYAVNPDTQEFRLLQMPIIASGSLIGYSVSLLDLDQDGSEELYIGAPQANHPDWGPMVGNISSYQPTETHWETTPDKEVWMPFFRSTGRFGYDIYSAGDFNGDGWEDLAVLGYTHRSSDYPGVVQPSTCAYKGHGAIYIYLGNEEGLSDAPAFRIQPQTGLNYPRQIAGGMDVNNDGYDDFLFANHTWNGNDGGVHLVLGRPHDGTENTLGVCDDIYVFKGIEGDEYLGHQLAPLGDIDDDGYDEFAVSAHYQDMGLTNQGVIWIVWGTPNPASGLDVTPIGSGRTYRYLGYAMNGGGDVNGDGIPDLISGNKNHRETGNTKGGAWLISGHHLQTLPRTPLDDWTIPIDAEVQPYTPDDELNYSLIGTRPGEEFGWSVDLTPSPNEDGTSWVVVGSRYGSTDSYSVSGTAQVFRWNPTTGFTGRPVAIVANEPGGKPFQLGYTVSGGSQEPNIVIGSIYSDALGPAQGAAYAARLFPEGSE